VRETLNGAAVGVGEEPFQQAFFAAQFGADNGCTYIERIGKACFAEAFGFTVDIERVVGIVFGVVAFGAAVDAVGSDGQDAGSGAVQGAGFGQQVGEEGIDHDGIFYARGIIVFAPRLDDTDAVDDKTGMKPA